MSRGGIGKRSKQAPTWEAFEKATRIRIGRPVRRRQRQEV